MAGAKKTEVKPAEKKGPAVIGINLGNAYASIAVINNVGLFGCVGVRDADGGDWDG